MHSIAFAIVAAAAIWQYATMYGDYQQMVDHRKRMRRVLWAILVLWALTPAVAATVPFLVMWAVL